MKDSQEYQAEEQQKKNKRKSAVITAAFHVILLLVFLIFGLSSAFPPPVEGILVNFGTMQTGSGDKPSEVVDQPEEISPRQTSPSASVPEPEESPAEIATQDIEETVPIKIEEEEEMKKQPEKKTKVEPEPVKEEKPVKDENTRPEKEEPRIDKESLYTGQKSSENSPSNEGELYTPGDQGDPEGDPTAKNHEGDSKGLGNIGVGYDLAGRNLLAVPPIEETYKETGKVVVSIKVDRNGKVIFAKYMVKGSTSTDPKLIRLAEEAAQQAKFSANSQAAEEQFGSITFTFKLK